MKCPNSGLHLLRYTSTVLLYTDDDSRTFTSEEEKSTSKLAEMCVAQRAYQELAEYGTLR